MNFKKLKISIGLSILVHLSLLLILAMHDEQPEKSLVHTINVEYIDSREKTKKQVSPPNEAKQIVDQGPAINHEVDEKAKYLSAHDQKVLQQTVANKRGAFQNLSENHPTPGRQGLNPGSTPKEEQKAHIEKPSHTKEVLNKFLPGFDFKAALQKREAQEKEFAQNKPQAKDPLQNQTQQGEVGGGPTSQTEDYLKDVNQGAQTLLSTREFVYFSYFSRIRNQLSQYWEPIIKQKITRMFKQGRQIASTEDKITKVIIVLDTRGVLVNVQVINASGISDLDEAAVEAFRAAAPFPNPPKGIEEKDGTIKIRWDFVLEA